jgi:transcriptional regulator with PAS, ATPase and Fis domain
MGALLREQFGVWVGFVDADGSSYPIGESYVTLDKPACARFQAISVLSNHSDERQTCLQSLRRWADPEQNPDAPLETSCHAGFAALIYSLRDHDVSRAGNTRAYLYISGYVRSEISHDQLGEIRETLEANELFDDDTDDQEAAVDVVPRLDRKDRTVMRTIANHMVDEVDRLLEGPTDQAEEMHSLVTSGQSFHGLVGASRQMREMFETIQIVADSNSTVLIEGESGTGKELIARALHLESPRREAPFVALNCAAISAGLIASELFGYKKGAFSGAHRDRVGLLQEADSGTLLLDEIGDMDMPLQVKLLRFLQEGTYMPVGGNIVRKVDVRVLCATNHDLRQRVREGVFRKDLYFRINVINLVSPPLRRRPTDIERIAGHFLSDAAKRHDRPMKILTDDCIEALKSHDWPGNVRELENEIERLVIMSGDAEVIDAQLVSKSISPDNAEPAFPDVGDIELPDAVEQLERTMILQGLRETGWNKSQTARDLGVSRRNLIRKVSQFDLERFRDD